VAVITRSVKSCIERPKGSDEVIGGERGSPCGELASEVAIHEVGVLDVAASKVSNLETSVRQLKDPSTLG
jgi:hypothetical protein